MVHWINIKWTHLYNHLSRSFPWAFPLYPKREPLSWLPALGRLVLPAFALYIDGTHTVCFSVCFFNSRLCLWSSSVVLCVAVVHFHCLWYSNIWMCCIYIRILSLNICVTTFLLLWIMLLWTILYASIGIRVCVYVCFVYKENWWVI